ncbi:MAG TPA: hypothetical protein VFC78_22035 [Tepidisphaeraceae bacterium]|nr:hypothetical protein [Tepidisphaeraceae bacterium]
MSRKKKKDAPARHPGPAAGHSLPLTMPYHRWVNFQGVCIGMRSAPEACADVLMRRLEDVAARLECVDVRTRWAMESLVLGLEALADVLGVDDPVHASGDGTHAFKILGEIA